MADTKDRYRTGGTGPAGMSDSSGRARSKSPAAMGAWQAALHAELEASMLAVSLEEAAFRSKGALEAILELMSKQSGPVAGIEPLEDIWVIARRDLSEIRRWLDHEISLAIAGERSALD